MPCLSPGKGQNIAELVLSGGRAVLVIEYLGSGSVSNCLGMWQNGRQACSKLLSLEGKTWQKCGQ